MSSWTSLHVDVKNGGKNYRQDMKKSYLLQETLTTMQN